MASESADRAAVHTSVAVVRTETPARYAKQLLSHLGRKVTARPLEAEPEGGELVFAYGVGTVRPAAGQLLLHASAADPESLARVEDVLTRHLVRFGARQELTVSWQRESGTRAGSAITPIHTPDAPEHSGPVPQAVTAGGWIHVSALFGVDPATGALPSDARDEAEQLFTNLVAILAAGKAALSDVVRVGIVMRDLHRDRPVFNEVWARRFGEHRPARSAIQATEFGRPGENARFMVEVAAYRG